MTTEYERWAELSDREATGEELSEIDRHFLISFSNEDERARAETALWERLAHLDAFGDDETTHRIADRAVAIVSKKSRKGGIWAAWLAGGAVAAAAAAAVFAVGRGTGSSHASALLELSLGEVRAAGVLVRQGDRIEPGTEVTVSGGPACLELESKMHACLGDGAVLRVSSIGSALRRLDLVKGRVDAALAPLSAGQRFSVVAGGVWSTAVGTAFSVEVLANGAVETIVHEGKVRVGAENGGDVVTAHKIGLSQGGVKVEGLGDHARTETPDWKALGRVAERSIEAPFEAAPEAPPTAAVAPVEPEVSTAKVAHVEGAPKAAPKVVEPAATAADLLSQARQALREKRWADAASSYRAIIGTYPSSPEAHTVLVPLANLEVDRLGQANAAIKHLDAYLSSGGPLVMEAELAKIRAFRSLGRASDEARAIDQFLAAHPKSLEAESLKQRRDALGQ